MSLTPICPPSPGSKPQPDEQAATLMGLPLELQQSITGFAIQSASEFGVRARGLVVSRLFVYNVEYLCKNHGRFLFDFRDFDHGKKPNQTICHFARSLGHTVTCLVYSLRDESFHGLPSALKELLKLFPNVEEVKLVDVTKRKLGIKDRAICYRAGSLMADLARSAPGWVWREIIDDFLFNDDLPFPWLKPIMAKSRLRNLGNIKHFSLEWEEGQLKKDIHGHFIHTDHTIPVMVNMLLRPNQVISDIGISARSLRRAHKYPSGDWLYLLANIAKDGLIEEKITDIERWESVLKALRLGERQRPGNDEILAMEDLLDEMWLRYTECAWDM